MAILHPRTAGACLPVALTMTAAEACSLSHELEGGTTLRSQAFGLLERLFSAVEARLVAVEIRPAHPGLVAARLRFEQAGRTFEVASEVGQAVGIALHAELPLWVSDDIIAMLNAHAEPLAARPVAEVPAAFIRAFDA